MWVANQAGNTLSKVRASDGVVQATVPVGTSPAGVVFDGTHVWVLNTGGKTLSRR